jgi:lipopolysaccharide assembly outer membrane protein LptD (OstA)
MKYSFFVLLFFILTFGVFSQEKMIPVVVDGDEINYLQEEGKIIAKGNVKLKYKEVELFCDEVHYDANGNKAHIIGDVKIIRDGTTMYANDIVYDFANMSAAMGRMRLEDCPIFAEAERIEKSADGSYGLNNGYATTCDLDKPHYRLVARNITVYPGEKVVAKNMFLMIGKIPVFYIPYFSQSLKDRSFPVNVSPGKNSEWGYFFLTRWRYNMNDTNRGTVHIDWYENRGQGYGITHKMESKKYGDMLIKYYRLEDEIYQGTNRGRLFDEYPDRASISDKYLEDDRFKGQFSYSWDPLPNLSIKSEINKFSDEYFMKDFFRREYDREPHPKTYALINYSFAHSNISLLGRKRVNRYLGETEYLPQLEYNFYRQNLGETNFYFESVDKIGNITLQRPFAGGNDSMRFHSDKVLSYQARIGFLRINPFIGSKTTYYSKRSDSDDDLLRLTHRAGATLSTKLYKFIDTDFDFWGQHVDKIRHILAPELSYIYQHKPSAPNSSVFQFDSVDNQAREESVRLTIRNKFQAKDETDGRVWDFLYFSPSVDYAINPEGRGSHFNSLSADLEVYPSKYLSLGADSYYDLLNGHFLEANADLTFKGIIKAIRADEELEEEKYSFSLGHRYYRGENSQGTLSFKYRLTPKLQFKNYMRYQYKTGDLDEQQYALRADLHCWWMDIGLNINRHIRGGKDLTFWMAFTLKAFPDISIDFDQTYDGAKASY